MSSEPFAQFLEALIVKFEAGGTFVTNPENIIIGESMGLLEYDNSKFPRLEFLITKLKFDGYIDQRNLNQVFRFSVGGHLRRDHDVTVPEDMYTAIKWAREIVRITYSLNSDRIGGIPVCDGFLQISGYNEIFLEYELFPKITSVILVAEAEIQLSDEYTNN